MCGKKPVAGARAGSAETKGDIMDLAKVDAILSRNNGNNGNGNNGEKPEILEVLQDIQESYRYLPEEALRRVSESMGVPLIEVYRLASFYKAFSLKPRGRHCLTACLGTACHVRGAPRVLDEVAGQLNVQPGETTEDGALTVEAVNCVGACALAPVTIIDGKYHHQMTPTKLREVLDDLRDGDQEGGSDA
jgi:NADH:ubiquinone oxidoreductase subunit E